MRRRAARRGSAFLTVLAVLTLLSLLMEVALALLVSHLSESRRRGDSEYAGELARSGLAWARACIASRGGACSTRLTVASGAIEVTSRFDGEMWQVTSRGIVLRAGAEGPSREATTRVAPPPAEGGAPSPGAPPAQEPVSPPATPPRSDPNDLRADETPRYF